jgi:hypothetical protein
MVCSMYFHSLPSFNIHIRTLSFLFYASCSLFLMLQISVVFQNASSSVRLCLACLLYKPQNCKKKNFCKVISYNIGLLLYDPLMCCKRFEKQPNNTTPISKQCQWFCGHQIIRNKTKKQPVILYFPKRLSQKALFEEEIKPLPKTAHIFSQSFININNLSTNCKEQKFHSIK